VELSQVACYTPWPDLFDVSHVLQKLANRGQLARLVTDLLGALGYMQLWAPCD
jgi:hypothetical protein